MHTRPHKAWVNERTAQVRACIFVPITRGRIRVHARIYHGERIFCMTGGVHGECRGSIGGAVGTVHAPFLLGPCAAPAPRLGLGANHAHTRQLLPPL